jgi:hypothetical protein
MPVVSGARQVLLEHADAMDCYAQWDDPTVIVVYDPYGVGGFPGDPLIAQGTWASGMSRTAGLETQWETPLDVCRKPKLQCSASMGRGIPNSCSKLKAASGLGGVSDLRDPRDDGSRGQRKRSGRCYNPNHRRARTKTS